MKSEALLVMAEIVTQGVLIGTVAHPILGQRRPPLVGGRCSALAQLQDSHCAAPVLQPLRAMDNRRFSARQTQQWADLWHDNQLV